MSTLVKLCGVFHTLKMLTLWIIKKLLIHRAFSESALYMYVQLHHCLNITEAKVSQRSCSIRGSSERGKEECGVCGGGESPPA